MPSAIWAFCSTSRKVVPRSTIDSEDSLAFSALTGVRPMTEVFPLEQADEAYERMMSGKARFRVVLDMT